MKHVKCVFQPLAETTYFHFCPGSDKPTPPLKPCTKHAQLDSAPKIYDDNPYVNRLVLRNSGRGTKPDDK